MVKIRRAKGKADADPKNSDLFQVYRAYLRNTEVAQLYFPDKGKTSDTSVNWPDVASKLSLKSIKIKGRRITAMGSRYPYLNVAISNVYYAIGTSWTTNSIGGNILTTGDAGEFTKEFTFTKGKYRFHRASMNGVYYSGADNSVDVGASSTTSGVSQSDHVVIDYLIIDYWDE